MGMAVVALPARGRFGRAYRAAACPPCWAVGGRRRGVPAGDTRLARRLQRGAETLQQRRFLRASLPAGGPADLRLDEPEGSARRRSLPCSGPLALLYEHLRDRRLSDRGPALGLQEKAPAGAPSHDLACGGARASELRSPSSR